MFDGEQKPPIALEAGTAPPEPLIEQPAPEPLEVKKPARKKKPAAKKPAKKFAKKKHAVKKKISTKKPTARKRPHKVAARKRGRPLLFPDKTIVRLPAGSLKKVNVKAKGKDQTQGEWLRNVIIRAASA